MLKGIINIILTPEACFVVFTTEICLVRAVLVERMKRNDHCMVDNNVT